MGIELGSMTEKSSATGGIRQGCCISTLLFKLVTFKIIEDLKKKTKYNIGKFEDNSIWLADDATLVAEDLSTLKELLDCLSKSGGRYGLQINEKKTKIMKIKGPDNQEHIGEYEMVTEATYLGINIGGRWRNIFEKENKKVLGKADRKVNTVLHEVKKSADKAVVGKAIWKLMAIPSLLFGRAVVPTCKTTIEALQRKENKVWRYLLGIGGYSTVTALRGEIGASMVKSRIMETSLQFVRSTMNSEFNNIKEMMMDTIETGVCKWYTMVNSFREELEIEWEELFNMSKEDLKKKIVEYDTKIWEHNLMNKSTLEYYKEGKVKIGYESCYRNNINSLFLARARINSLKLEEAKGRGKKFYNKNCKLCGLGVENLVHFIVECPAIERKRNYELLDRNLINPKQRLIKFLYDRGKYQEKGAMIKHLWYERKALLKEEEERRLKPNRINVTVGLGRSDPGPKGNLYTPIRGRSQVIPATKG